LISNFELQTSHFVKGGDRLDEGELIHDCEKGDQEAFGKLIEKYYQPLMKFFYKHLGESRVCEDLTQDVVLKLIENIVKYRPFTGVKFSTWLFKIAYNTYVDYLQRMPGKRECEFQETSFLETSGEPLVQVEEMALAESEQGSLRKYLIQMPPQMKSLLVLRYFQEFSYVEIGQVMGLSPKEVKWKLHNALEKLRQAMTKERMEGGSGSVQKKAGSKF
jgi:RNA polymerase sigma-70 factor (ECF subfamily)